MMFRNKCKCEQVCPHGEKCFLKCSDSNCIQQGLETHSQETKTTPLKQSIYILYIIFGVIAMALSWSCNTKEGYSVPARIINAIFAGFANIAYVFWFMILRSDYCFYDKCKVK